MARFPGVEAVYQAAELFRQRCLTTRHSFLWPEHQAWTPENIHTLRSAFMDHPDEGDRTFVEKWHDQLAREPVEVHRVAADVLAFYYLYSSTVSQGPKLEKVKQVINWKLAADQPDISLLTQAFSKGIGSGGIHYNTAQPWAIAYYLEFARELLLRGVNPQDEQACRQLADELAAQLRQTSSARNVLLHLLFPDHFERIISQRHKQLIVKAFRKDTEGVTDLDDALGMIRQHLVQRLNRPDFDFYIPEIESQWNPDAQATPAGPAHSETNVWLFQANPRHFDLAQRVRQVVVGTSDDWTVSRFQESMHSGDVVLLWQAGQQAGIYAVGKLTGAPTLQKEEQDAPSWVAARASNDGTWWSVPFHYTTILRNPLTKAALLEDPVLSTLSVLRAPQGTNFRVTPEQWNALKSLLAEVQVEGPQLEQLVEKSNLSSAELLEMEFLLREKRQLIFTGPPGVGKTYIAELLARYVTGNALVGPVDERIVFVQFHQSYSYEDFIQGIRPETTSAGQLEYRVREGLFLRLCTVARSNPDQAFILIIDEINRGNISRIFGEALQLLEYREKQVELPYTNLTGERFSIPRNVYLIGTMNTADRSLAQIDYALRRRFYFYELLSVKDGTAPVFQRWLEKKSAVSLEAQSRLLQLFLALNSRIEQELGREFQIGHSYFMVENIWTEPVLQRVWQYAVRPLLEEYFHSRRDREKLLDEFQIDHLLTLAPSFAMESKPA